MLVPSPARRTHSDSHPGAAGATPSPTFQPLRTSLSAQLSRILWLQERASGSAFVPRGGQVPAGQDAEDAVELGIPNWGRSLPAALPAAVAAAAAVVAAVAAAEIVRLSAGHIFQTYITTAFPRIGEPHSISPSSAECRLPAAVVKLDLAKV